MAVVLARSYSRNSGSTSQLRLTVTPAASRARPTRRSWSGLTKLNSRHTAACRSPRRWTSRTSRSISPPSSGVTTPPRASTRSRTVNQFASGVIGGGRTTRRAYRLRAVLPADQQQVAEPLGGDERDRLAGPLEQGVGGHRRPVHDLPRRRPAGRGRGHGVQHGPLERRRRGRHFHHFQLARGRVPRHQIGERPAHVHAHEQAGRRRLLTVFDRHTMGPK